MKKKLTKKEECQHFLHNNPKFICPSCEHNCSGGFVKEIGEGKWCARCDMNLSKQLAKRFKEVKEKLQAKE